MRILLFVFLIASSVISYTQDFPYTKYTISDGLAQSQVLDLIVDNKDRVWAATNGGGVSVFDGVSFTNYTKKEGLSSDYVYSLFKDSKDNIWIGTNNGVTFYNNKAFYQYTNAFKEYEIIRSITETKDGSILVGSDFGLKKFNEGKFENYITNSIIDSSIILKVFIDIDDNIWVGTKKNGIIRFDGISIKQFTKKDGLLYNTVPVIMQDANKNIIFGTYRGAGYIDSNFKLYLEDKNNKQTFTAGIKTFNSDIILITYTGWLIKGKIINSQIKKDLTIQLPEKSLRSVCEDSEGNIWIGTESGLIKFDFKIKFLSYYFNNKSSKKEIYVNAVYVNDSNIFVSDDRLGIRVIDIDSKRIKPDIKDTLFKYPSLISTRISSFAYNGTDTLWMSSMAGITAFNLKTKEIVSYSSIDNTKANRKFLPKKFSPRVNTSIVLNDSSIWFGTLEGIIIYKNGVFSLLAEKSPKYSNIKNIEIISLLKDGNNVWASTKNGILKITKNGIQNIGAREGFVDTQVNSLIIDSKNNLWLSSREGLFFYDRKKFVNISDKFNLNFGSIYIIEKDDLNNIYIGTNKGLDKISLKYFYQNDTIIVKHFGKAEGFSGVECNRNASFKDKDGNLWFGTINGVVKFFPDMDISNDIEPNTYITDVMLNLGKDSLAQYCEGISNDNLPLNLQLNYNKTHLTFHFISTSKKIESKVRYEYKLLPLSEEWAPITNNVADFPVLPDGKYTFLVRSCNNDGIWDETPAEFIFIVNPPFWKTIWFIILGVIAAVVIVYLYIISRERKLKKEKQVLEYNVAERTKEVVKQKEIVEEKNKDITDSINYARNIQQALLPGNDDFKNSFDNSLIVYKPRDIVSGDFYWLSNKNNRTFVTAADSTGHGVPGAFMSMLGMAFLDEIVSNNFTIDAAEVLNQMRKNVMSSLKQGKKGKSRDGMDMAISIIDRNTNILHFSGANNPLYIISKDTEKIDSFNGEEKHIIPKINGSNDYNLFEIKPDKMPIGYYLKNDNFTNHKLEIHKGDIIYMFSDGYADQFGGEDGKKFKYKKFKELLLSIATLSIEEQREQIDNTFENWKYGFEQLDDIVVIGIML